MMAERRVVVVREFDKLSNKDPLLSYIHHPSPTTSLVLLSSKPDFRLKFYKTLKESSVTVESKPLYESEIPQWINKKIEQRGKQISLQACQMMQNYVGRSLREIHNEIEKLFIYVGEKPNIEADDINMVVGMSRQYNVYELQNAVGAKDIARSLEIAEHMLEAGEQPIGMIVMLTRYIQRLWVINDSLARKKPKTEIATLLKISPKQMFWLDADLQKARKFTLRELERGFLLLREADERLKTSNGDAKLVMTLFLYQFIKGEMAEVEA
jgi:DNA polymerase-3 subunit delta